MNKTIIVEVPSTAGVTTDNSGNASIPKITVTEADVAGTRQRGINASILPHWVYAIVDVVGAAALAVADDGSVDISQLSADTLNSINTVVSTVLTVASAQLKSGADNAASDVFAFVDSQGKSPFVIRADGSVTINIAADSTFPASISNAEVTAARGSRTDLNSRVSRAINSYGFPYDYMANEWQLRWTRMLLRKLLLGDSSTQFDIALIGDSYTHNVARWSGPLWQTLKTTYGDAGVGWVGFAMLSNNTGFRNGSVRSDTSITSTGFGTTTYYGQKSPDLGELTSTTAGDQVVVTFPAGQSSAKLFYVGTSDGNITYQFNGGGSSHSLALTSGAGTLQTATLTAPSGTATTLTITVVSGTVTLCGVDIRSTANGVRVHKLAATGSSANNWASVQTASWNAGIAAIKPQLIIVLHGANDQTGGTPPSSFAGYLQTIITNINASLTATAVDKAIVMPAENQRGLPTTMASYATAAQPVADANSTAYLDTQYLFGDNAADYAFGSARPWYASDNLHPDPNTGGRVIVDGVLRLLTGR